MVKKKKKVMKKMMRIRMRMRMTKRRSTTTHCFFQWRLLPQLKRF